MKIKLNIKVYHGTDFRRVEKIIANGFRPNTNSCACQDKKYASGYGNMVIGFKYPYLLEFNINNAREDFYILRHFLIDFFRKGIIVNVSGFKPKKVKIVKLTK